MAQTIMHEDGHAYRFGFASQLIGRAVRSDGKKGGRIKDLIVTRIKPYPEIVGLVVRRNKRDYYVPMTQIGDWDNMSKGRVSLPLPETEFAFGNDSRFSLKDVLMDKQVVDTQGAKVERINDVQLLLLQGRTYVVHVDVGFTGLLRRLGFEGVARGVAGIFGKSLADDMISWKHVQTLEEGGGPGPVRLLVDHAELKSLHPGEMADILEDLDKDERVALLHSVDIETAAEALEEVEPELGAAIMQDLDPEVAADIMEEIEPSVAADIFEDIPAEQQEIIKSRMVEEEREELEKLQTFSEKETAGALMTTDYIALSPTATVADALRLIRASSDTVELIHYAFLVDGSDHLQGVVSLRSLIISKPETPLNELAGDRLISVQLDDGWVEVARQFHKYNFLALPVLDEDRKVQGIITFQHSFDELIPFYHKEAA
jgi:magnesium transporter